MKILKNKEYKTMIDYQVEQLEKICNLQQEIKRLKERLDISQTAYLAVNEKNEKAIEYIEKHSSGIITANEGIVYVVPSGNILQILKDEKKTI